ncbi:hypothetical protein DFH09DRAFT_1375926 [Mycena vulgaris]|nr:hypothetical protein DFH09DRAFT_1375926 [Mycena vulgaris]
MYDVVVVSAALYGAGIVQGWFYYQKYFRKDPMMIKLLVALTLLCDTCHHVLLTESSKSFIWKSHSCLSFCAVYVYLVTGHLDQLAFGRVVKTFVIEVYPSALIALIVRNFYAYRIYRLSNNNWMLGGSISFLSIGAFATILFYVTKLMGFDDILDLLAVKNIAVTVNIIGAGVDSLISVVMIFLLHRQKGGNRKTTDLLNRLIIFTFAAGVPTSICALASAVSVLASPKTMLYMFWFLMLGSLYTNSLLVTLNARDYIRSRNNSEFEGIRMQSGLRFHSAADIMSPTRAVLPSSDNPITIRIDKHTEIDLERGGHGYCTTDNSESKPQI